MQLYRNFLPIPCAIICMRTTLGCRAAPPAKSVYRPFLSYSLSRPAQSLSLYSQAGSQVFNPFSSSFFFVRPLPSHPLLAMQLAKLVRAISNRRASERLFLFFPWSLLLLLLLLGHLSSAVRRIAARFSAENTHTRRS